MTKKTKYSTTEVAKYLSSAPKAINAYISDLEKQIQNLANIGFKLNCSEYNKLQSIGPIAQLVRAADS